MLSNRFLQPPLALPARFSCRAGQQRSGERDYDLQPPLWVQPGFLRTGRKPPASLWMCQTTSASSRLQAEWLPVRDIMLRRGRRINSCLTGSVRHYFVYTLQAAFQSPRKDEGGKHAQQVLSSDVGVVLDNHCNCRLRTAVAAKHLGGVEGNDS